EGGGEVAGLGLAKEVEGDQQLSRTGHILGTPAYMAPEQAAGRVRPVGATTDVYALGGLLYECLTGQVPFRGTTSFETMQQVLTREPVPPRRLVPGLSRDLETICLKCLHKEPARRYASAQALADDLARWQRGEPIQARPVGRLERGWRWCRRNKAVASLLGAVAASLLLGTGVATWFAVEARTKAEAEAKAKGEAEQQLEVARSHLFTAQLMRVAAIYERDPRQSLELLHDYRACPINRRDFAWGLYERLCRGQPLRAALTGHTAAVVSVIFSPDGKTLAAWSGTVIKLWDVATGH